MKATIFDFNGTLFFDSDINRIAWEQTINELSDNTIDFDEVYKEYKSVRNYIFVKAMFERLNKPLNEEDIMYWVKRKETRYYHTYCREHNRNKLAPGASELLDYLKENNYPINLCTASIKENVDFYFDYLGLKNWFDINKIAYDDGNFIDKVEMYRAAAERINTDIADCLVFEDSPVSINQAIKAGCHNIVMIGKDKDFDCKEIIQKINDFTEFDRDLLYR